MNDNIKRIVERYAAAGYAAIAPDLFWRQQAGVELDPAAPGPHERAVALMQGLDQNLAVDDALIAAQYLRTLDPAASRVGAIGYCLDGKLAGRPGIDAATLDFLKTTLRSGNAG